ncbi:hypothetical protein GGH19_003962 [Coemansia sp. RSA 1807]|nr:hypothetical protein GGH19_003962 [Coemansia sp. RSA 1807]
MYNSTEPARPWRPTLHETRIYNYLYSLVDMQHSGIVSELSVRELLNKSCLAPAYTHKIWLLATGGSGTTQMSKREFYTAMKLVSLAQSGRPLSLAIVSEFTSPPVFSGIDANKASPSANRSSVLRYSPQPTIELDNIISSAWYSTSESSLASTVGTVTPPRSPVSTVMYLDDCDLNQGFDSLSMLTPELQHPNVPSPKPELRVNTKLAAKLRSIEYSPNSGSSTAEPLSTDSITELLSRIDTAITSTQNSSTAHQVYSSTALRSELEGKIAELQHTCDTEKSHNEQLVTRLSSEESQIKSLSAQISRAQSHVAYVARQRAQLVERLQRVEGQQQEMRGRLQTAETETERCSGDVGQLDMKMFGMERNIVHMQRHAKFQQMSSGSSPGNTVLVRYQTAKRNRLSSVFRKPAIA